MRTQRAAAGEPIVLRIGGGCAILGAIAQIAAGALFGNRTGEGGVEMLRFLAGQPAWYWPLAYLCFIAGAVLWVCAFVGIAAATREGASWALGLLALATIVIGATMHVVDASLNAGALPMLADAWRASPADEQGALVQEADGLLRILGGTWATVITLFHGVPFVLSGLSLAWSNRFPWWLGWIGAVGGAGSLIAGLAIFFHVPGFPIGVYVPFAIVISVYMVIAGWYLLTQADETVGSLRGNST
jgi:hypothetical protein